MSKFIIDYYTSFRVIEHSNIRIFNTFCGIPVYMHKATTSESTAPVETMTQTSPKESKHRQLIKPKELILAVLFIGIVALLLTILINDIRLKRDVTAAQNISTQVISAINKRDGIAIWRLGSPTFQHQYTPASLTQGFKDVEIATLKMPTLKQQTVVDTSQGRDVYFVYEYTALKVPFYVRTGIEHRSGHWYLTSIAGNIDESQLTVN